MAKPSRFEELHRTVTVDVVEHARDLSRHYVERLGVSRVTANKYIQKLETHGWIARSGPSTHPVFSPGYQRQIVKSYPLQGLEEHIAWDQDFRPYFNLPPNVMNIANHGFTEMLNNAVDHSNGRSVWVVMRQDASLLGIAVVDDGVGIFDKITQSLALPDKRLALLELSKGKFTTDPSNHSGEGIFFTSRMFDHFIIRANGLEFSHDSDAPQDLLMEVPRPETSSNTGTEVLMVIALNASRTTHEVYSQFTNAPEDFDFSKTIVPMRLARFGDEQLVSRSQAKRLIARFDRFRTVVLDFSGIHEIGQAFADELFRVYALNHPSVELAPTHMTEQVERMWRRALSHNRAAPPQSPP